jgi:hypothetical protein
MTTKRQPKITEEDTTIYANTLNNTNRQQTRTKMGQPPHERTNHGDFHTHRQMKIKQKLTKTPTNMDRGKTRNKKHEKGSNKIGRSNFFHDRTHFKQS